MTRPLVVLFAKAPVAGRVKTRLCPPLTPVEASELHSAFVSDAGETIMGLAESVDLELSTDVTTEAWPEIGAARSVQVAGDLGARLLDVIGHGLSAGREVAMAMGSDSPGLPAAHVLELVGSAADVTLGPTEDGGFYAIACRAVHREMFFGVRWSTEHALSDVVRQASACGLSISLGPSWFDVDVEADLPRLVDMPGLGRNTAEWARRYGKR